MHFSYKKRDFLSVKSHYLIYKFTLMIEMKNYRKGFFMPILKGVHWDEGERKAFA